MLREFFKYTKKISRSATTGRNPHTLTYLRKDNVENVIDNKTNAYYTKKNADGAEAVHIVGVTFSND
jgi:hypothetical protein